MDARQYLIENFVNRSDDEIIRITSILGICANEFFPKTHSETCTYSTNKEIWECERCWLYALNTDQEDK